MLLLDGEIRGGAAWRQVTRQGQKQYEVRCGTLRMPTTSQSYAFTPHELGVVLCQFFRFDCGSGPWRLAVEDVYLGENRQTALHLIRWAGMVAGPLTTHAAGEVQWPAADQWRALSFRRSWWSAQAAENGAAANQKRAKREGIPFLAKREAAKREAAKVIPLLIPNASWVARLLGSEEHVYDACGIARWASLENVT
jgi:hypothetical protein